MRKSIIIVGIILLLAVMAGFVFLGGIRSFREVREFPSLHITSQMHPFEAERTYWHPGTLTLEGANHYWDFEDVEIRIRGRGNSTWVRTTEKRPLRVRFETPQQFMSENSHRDWILLANHFDMSLMRNYGALYLASLLKGMSHAPMVQNVHLYINGEYVGVYLLTDERDVAPGRTELIAHDDPEISEYFFELDGHILGWLSGGSTLGEDYFLADGLAYDIRFPSGRMRTTEHVKYLQNYVYAVGEAFRSNDLQRVKALVDINSMVDFYIVQELFKNIDVREFSVFMQIRGQGENRRLYFGPVWDFDRSAGNTIHWYTYEFIYAGEYNVWFRDALETPGLDDIIRARWEDVSSEAIPEMISRLRYLRRNYAADFRRDSSLYNIYQTRPEWLYDISPEPIRTLPTWESQADHLISWLEKRTQWLDWFFKYFHEHDWEE